MSRVASALTRIACALVVATAFAGSAHAADLAKSVKSAADPIKSINRMTEPNEAPTVADLVNANKIDGTVDDEVADDERFYINGDSQGDGTFSLEVQKRLLEF